MKLCVLLPEIMDPRFYPQTSEQGFVFGPQVKGTWSRGDPTRGLRMESVPQLPVLRNGEKSDGDMVGNPRV